jgi:DNA-binding transcriptional MerR regulator
MNGNAISGITISELAERAGINTSTVRYYERAGLVPDPDRSANGYRRYSPDHETRLLFITRARNLGLSIDQIAELLGVWDGTNCATTRSHVAAVIASNISDIEGRIADLRLLAADLTAARDRLAGGPAVCEPGLACCAPNIGPTRSTVSIRVGRVS